MGVFISYRRNDAGWAAGRIRDQIASRIGSGRIFMDVDNIPLGSDFRKVIDNHLDRSSIMITIIGHNWAGYVGKKKTPNGHSAAFLALTALTTSTMALSNNNEIEIFRIHETNDMVRYEVGAAIKMNCTVIPILVDGATIPENLPYDLQEIRNLQCISLNQENYKLQADRIVDRVVEILDQ